VNEYAGISGRWREQQISPVRFARVEMTLGLVGVAFATRGWGEVTVNSAVHEEKAA
jgi:hypothetical protein